MNFTRTVILVVVFLVILLSCADTRKRKPRRSKRNHVTCRPRSLVRYQMTVHTTWNKTAFPKQFPTYRPPAHWSQLIGRSHSGIYKMWQEDVVASEAVQKFAEGENAESFDLELSQGYNGVLDAFVAPTINTSVGQTSAVVSLDGRHSQVSFMMKIVPSPDWFIGVDSAELCYRGRWRKSYSRDLRPFDAGTAQGRTFTAPKWANDPKEPISAITSSIPDHPASSFFYPEYRTLPRIAYVEFEMISEYRLRKVHKKIIAIPQRNTSSDTNTASANQKSAAEELQSVFKYNEDGDTDIAAKLASLSSHNKTLESPQNQNSFLSLMSTPSEKLPTSDESVNSRDYHPTVTSSSKPTPHVIKPALEMRSLSTSQFGSRNDMPNPVQRMPSPTTGQEMSGPATTTTDKDSVKLQDSHVQETLTKETLEEYQKRVDCQVSEWSEWSPCSQTCGFGNKQRSRDVLIPNRHGGTFCPLLREQELCGSMRGCQWKHFSFMSKKVNSPFKALRRRRRRRH